MDYDEPEDFKLYDLCYRATKAQANAIWLALIQTDEWAIYEEVDNLLRFDQAGSLPVEHYRNLCKSRVMKLVSMTKIVHGLIQEHTGG